MSPSLQSYTFPEQHNIYDRLVHAHLSLNGMLQGGPPTSRGCKPGVPLAACDCVLLAVRVCRLSKGHIPMPAQSSPSDLRTAPPSICSPSWLQGASVHVIMCIKGGVCPAPLAVAVAAGGLFHRHTTAAGVELVADLDEVLLGLPSCVEQCFGKPQSACPSLVRPLGLRGGRLRRGAEGLRGPVEAAGGERERGCGGGGGGGGGEVHAVVCPAGVSFHWTLLVLKLNRRQPISCGLPALQHLPRPSHCSCTRLPPPLLPLQGMDCKLCGHCLSKLERQQLRLLLAEHKSQMGFTRVYPPGAPPACLQWLIVMQPTYIRLQGGTQTTLWMSTVVMLAANAIMLVELDLPSAAFCCLHLAVAMRIAFARAAWFRILSAAGHILLQHGACHFAPRQQAYHTYNT